MYIKPSMTKFAAASVAVIVMALVASRQLYLFAASRSGEGLVDARGGGAHLWLAAGALLAASVAACLMFLFFLGVGKSVPPEVPASTGIKSNTNSPSRAQFNAERWGESNEWCVAGQADDRRPMSGGVMRGTGSASARRAAARLTHQGRYKVWAQARHD